MKPPSLPMKPQKQKHVSGGIPDDHKTPRVKAGGPTVSFRPDLISSQFLGAKAISRGIRKLAQYMDLAGATSRTL